MAGCHCVFRTRSSHICHWLGNRMLRHRSRNPSSICGSPIYKNKSELYRTLFWPQQPQQRRRQKTLIPPSCEVHNYRQSSIAASVRGASSERGSEQREDNALQRVISGLFLGSLGSFTIYVGGILFTGKLRYAIATGKVHTLVVLSIELRHAGVVCLCSYQVCQEFYGFVTSKEVGEGSQPPPQSVTVLTSLLCTCFALFTYLSKGKATAALAVAAFAVLSLQLLTSENIGLSELALTVLGLFYCGYLPSYWIKLRLLSIPSTATVTSGLPATFGASTQWTVGLVATLLSVGSIVAADTGAYFFGKTFGRTRLHAISPKKTVEGAIGGLFCSSSAALLAWKLLAWPSSPLLAFGLGVLVFFGSLFGDLIESVMKRDAGLKDAGNLIPGHGGLLDRVDSFTWCGALVFFLLKFVIAYGI